MRSADGCSMVWTNPSRVNRLSVFRDREHFTLLYPRPISLTTGRGAQPEGKGSFALLWATWLSTVGQNTFPG